MKILFMADVPPDAHSGAAGTELRTAEALRQLGHEVDEIWASQLGRRIGHGNLHYLLELPRTYRRELQRAMRRRQYDVAHVNQPHGFLAARELAGTGTAFIHRSHGMELRAEEVLEPWRRRFGHARPSWPRRLARNGVATLLARHTREIARFADGHIVSCSDDAAFLSTRLRVDPLRVAVIPQAASGRFLSLPNPPMTRERLRRVLYVSQFAFFKAPMVVAGAMRRLAADDVTLRFTWVCSRAHHDEVRRLLGDAADRVTLRDWMPQDELVDVFDAHGIFLFGSFFEGFGKVFLEAMTRGLCVVATNVAGAHDIISDGVDGIRVPPGDVDAMAGGVSSLLRDPAKAIRIASAAAATGRTHTWERVARETATFYQSVCDRKRA